jgi:PadR family transcriptional regulator, regulatory protein PadR
MVFSESARTYGFRYFAGTLRSELTNSYFFSLMEEMAERDYLGEFELMVILAVARLGDEAYGVPVSRELEKHRRRDVSVSSVYAALDRLEGKGFVSSRLGDATQERGGRAKRYFLVTKEGLRVVHETRRILTVLWRRLPVLEGESA